MCECLRACVRACECGCIGAGVGLLVRSLNNPACNEQPYCYLQPLWLHQIFQHFLINGMISGETLLSVKYVFWFSLQALFETSLILKIIQPDVITDKKVFR